WDLGFGIWDFEVTNRATRTANRERHGSHIIRRRMQISERTSDDVTIVDLSGALSLGPATERLHDKINSLLQQGRQRIILNLGEVTSVDSGGLGELVRTHTSTKNRGGAVKVVNL